LQDAWCERAELLGVSGKETARVQGLTGAYCVAVDDFTVSLLLVEEVSGEIGLGRGGNCQHGSGGDDAQDRFHIFSFGVLLVRILGILFLLMSFRSFDTNEDRPRILEKEFTWR